ncbi:MAG: hypothetical protein CL843_16280 [Crocinitomicaceae bacterium]|nr:hypothetical protein [Crocinitomicaceae bacterium]|tara:strand:- start:9259 stop:10110 length:852 start_codon:yes stop_codon:yes gene_type:complete
MDNHVKELIAEEIKRLSTQYSQAKVAEMIDVSSATCNHMQNGKWQLISDSKWRKVMVNLKLDPFWNIAETHTLKTMEALLFAVQKRHLSILISENAGFGKSEAYKHYSKKYINVIHVECKQYWSKKSYVKNLLQTCGLSQHGTTEELIERFLTYAKEQDSLLMIIDQADKLKPNQFDLFMDFYNDLFGHVGFVLSGVPALQKRLLKGVQSDKPGYREIWSRIGSKVYDGLNEPTMKDVESICKANGVDNEGDIVYIYNVSNGDLRKVRREIEKIQLAQNRNAA